LRKESLMVFPKPEWIRYKVELTADCIQLNDAKIMFPKARCSHIYIYAHGEQMVRDILDDYLVTKIERKDKDD